MANAIVLDEQNKTGEADKEQLIATEMDARNGELYILKARRLNRAGKTDEAIASVREALKLDPKRAQFYAELAKLLISKPGGAKEAVDAITKATQAMGESPKLLTLKGDCQRAAEDLDAPRPATRRPSAPPRATSGRTRCWRWRTSPRPRGSCPRPGAVREGQERVHALDQEAGRVPGRDGPDPRGAGPAQGGPGEVQAGGRADATYAPSTGTSQDVLGGKKKDSASRRMRCARSTSSTTPRAQRPDCQKCIELASARSRGRPAAAGREPPSGVARNGGAAPRFP
jgi:hypothetical protein